MALLFFLVRTDFCHGMNTQKLGKGSFLSLLSFSPSLPIQAGSFPPSFHLSLLLLKRLNLFDQVLSQHSCKGKMNEAL